jgi:hypothetical protein
MVTSILHSPITNEATLNTTFRILTVTIHLSEKKSKGFHLNLFWNLPKKLEDQKTPIAFGLNVEILKSITAII